MTRHLSRRQMLATAGGLCASGARAGPVPPAKQAETRTTRAAPSSVARASSSGAAQSRQPNLLLILADDLGFGDLSCYGATDIRTPAIDSLASAGVRFTNFYSNSPVCSPTRAALMTGRFPDLVGVPGVIRTHANNSWGYLAPDATLLPQVLRPAGYHTALVGKWHLGLDSPNTPTERGFDFFHGFLGDMMDDYYTHRRHGNNYLRRNRQTIDPQGHATDLFTDWAVDYLSERKRDNRPFFLYLAYNAPHTPIQPPEEWMRRIEQRHPGMAPKRARLAALVEHMDASLGRVLSALKANGQFENTFIVFTSDNGGELNAGGTCGGLRGGKQDMFEGGIRVPMCAVWPGRIRAGATSDRVGLSMDLFPTVCEAAGARPTSPIDGVSLLPHLLGGAQPEPPRNLLWVRREGGPTYHGQDYFAIRRGNWKLVQNRPFERYLLFNLHEDPLERNDLAATRPEEMRQLTEALSRHIQQAGRVPWQP